MLRRSALKRGKPLKRSGPIARGSCTLRAKKPMRRKRAGPPRRGREHDPAHLDFVRALPCAACGKRPTPERPTHAHHATHGRGKSQKVDDRKAFPLCDPFGCHTDFHAHRGRFIGWTKLQRRAWQEEQIAAVLAIAPVRADTQGA